MPFKKGHKNSFRKSTGSTRRVTPAKRRSDESEDDGPEIEAGDDVQESTEVATPRGNPDTPAGDDDDNEEDGEGDENDDNENEDDEDEDGPVITTIPRRKRPRVGRRSTARDGNDTPEPGDDDASESGTPNKRRKAGRQSAGGRAAARARTGKRSHGDQPHVLVDGERIEVVNDEALIDQDDEGDTKVDELGNLQGGREYRVRTFKVIERGDRMYMLSTEPARCCGFRDSYLFFAKHPKLFKLLLSEPQKKDLIDRDILPNSYKGRNIGVVTARSVFREFGARIIVGGKRVTDDYKVAEARADGVEEGALADPEDRLPGGHEEYNRNRYVAWFGASDVYRTSAAQQGADKKSILAARKRNNVTILNWQIVHAKEAGAFNSRIAQARNSTQEGVYDNNTNLLFYPSSTQPTHALWEEVKPDVRKQQSAATNGLTNGHHEAEAEEVEGEETIFAPVPKGLAQDYTIVDTVYLAPSIAGAGYPGPDGAVTDTTSGGQGLCNVPEELLDELPPECRRAFDAALETERRWKEQWSTERRSGLRGDLKIGFVGYPV